MSVDAATWLLVIGCALALLLAVPVEIAFRLQSAGQWRGQVVVRWLFGLARFCVAWPGASRRRPRAAPSSPRAPPSGRSRHVSRIVAALEEPALRTRLLRLARDLLRALHPSLLKLHLRIGLGDPADTGVVWGLLVPLRMAIPGRHAADIRIAPDFIDCVFEVDASGRIVLVPARVVQIALAFALSWASLRAGLQFARRRERADA